MEANLQASLEIKPIADQAGFSTFHFQRLFQAISGFIAADPPPEARSTHLLVQH
ncbi:AraC family transcriptional regulator [Paenibacillus sp. P96]|uniref:AraC family transcriptional regulator n=2 Tax=Paenibacillus zeirhizosphaerae TaxID=2987519 RepID=A0ABT9FUE6_9BACL|nr:helix-turn-helix transcriptional regulator [Paenibacillus sp. P96]MDP4098358.1 AraC family transcriptional regulator [Paenibacillus sp. P96]